MMRIALVLTIMLAGCATAPRPDVRNTYLVCGSAVRVDISHDGEAAVLRENEGAEVTLRRAPSAVATRYEGGGVSIQRTDDIYIYTMRDGTTLNCDTLPRVK